MFSHIKKQCDARDEFILLLYILQRKCSQVDVAHVMKIDDFIVIFGPINPDKIDQLNESDDFLGRFCSSLFSFSE